MSALLRPWVHVLFVWAAAGHATPGDLDPTFNGSGRVWFDTFESHAYSVVQQTDQKIVLAGIGIGSTGWYWDFGIARLNPDGTRDATFGANGITTVEFTNFSDQANVVIQQSDGRLVLAGWSDSAGGQGDIALARLNVDGTPDLTFGNAGKVVLDLGGSDQAASLVQQADGKLVIAGTSNAGSTSQMVFVRFNADGTHDATFGTAGVTRIDFGSGKFSVANGLVQQADGKLVAVGYAGDDPTTLEFAAVRVTEDGALDTSFDGDGLVSMNLTGFAALASSATVQPDGKIVMAGYAATSATGPAAAALLRLNADGSPDGTFGSAGVSVVQLAATDSRLNGIVARPDGKLVAVGEGFGAGTPAPRDMLVARFNADGTLDATWGAGGVAIADFGQSDTAAQSIGNAIARQSDGKFVVAGSSSLGAFVAARFDDASVFPGLIGFANTSSFVDETAGTVTYTVRRTGGAAGAVSVDYATASGTAIAGADFTAASGTLSWNDGDASYRQIVVAIIDDATIEKNESFVLDLSAPTGGAQLAATAATTTIGSDDGPGQLSFLDALDLLSVSESGTTVSVNVQRTGGRTGAVTVHYGTVSAAATAGTDFVAASGTLSWASGDQSGRTLHVTILNDVTAEAPEQFRIQLSNPTGGAGVPLLGGVQYIGISDDDATPAGTIQGGAASASVGESAGPASITVSRVGGSTGAVSVQYATAGLSATSGTDFTPASGTLVWANGDSADKTITVDVLDDAMDEGGETFTLTLSNQTGGASLGTPSSQTVTITDDDGAAGGGGGGGAMGIGDLVLLLLPALRRSRLKPLPQLRKWSRSRSG